MGAFCSSSDKVRRGKRNFFRAAIHHADALLDAGIDHKSSADDARSGICVPSVLLQSDDVDGAANHIAAGSGDDGVHLRVTAHAEFIPLSFGNIQLFSLAEPTIDTVGFSPRRSVVPSRDDFVVVHNDRAVTAPQAGASSGYCLCDIEIVLVFGDSFHIYPSLLSRCRILRMQGLGQASLERNALCS